MLNNNPVLDVRKLIRRRISPLSLSQIMMRLSSICLHPPRLISLVLDDSMYNPSSVDDNYKMEEITCKGLVTKFNGKQQSLIPWLNHIWEQCISDTWSPAPYFPNDKGITYDLLSFTAIDKEDIHTNAQAWWIQLMHQHLVTNKTPPNFIHVYLVDSLWTPSRMTFIAWLCTWWMRQSFMMVCTCFGSFVIMFIKMPFPSSQMSRLRFSPRHSLPTTKATCRSTYTSSTIN